MKGTKLRGWFRPTTIAKLALGIAGTIGRGGRDKEKAFKRKTELAGERREGGEKESAEL